MAIVAFDNFCLTFVHSLILEILIVFLETIAWANFTQ